MYSDAEKKRLVFLVCELMGVGLPTGKACREAKIPKATFLHWVATGEPWILDLYSEARGQILDHWAEEVLTLADQDPERIVDASGAARLDSASVQHARLRVESRKWLLSKLAPKKYGEKIVQEHTGVDGGPIAMASVNLKSMSDIELAQLRGLMTKVSQSS